MANHTINITPTPEAYANIRSGMLSSAEGRIRGTKEELKITRDFLPELLVALHAIDSQAALEECRQSVERMVEKAEAIVDKVVSTRPSSFKLKHTGTPSSTFANFGLVGWLQNDVMPALHKHFDPELRFGDYGIFTTDEIMILQAHLEHATNETIVNMDDDEPITYTTEEIADIYSDLLAEQEKAFNERS